MKAIVALVLAVAATGAAATPQLAAKGGCTACHAVDKKLIGPSWQDVAKKYKGQADAAARLATQLRQGSSGAWGKVPMPAVDPKTLSDADLKAVLAWALKSP